jgi:DNA-binding NarL/FixJ family response regulator
MERYLKPSGRPITCVILSAHPLVLCTIRDVLAAHADLAGFIKPYFNAPKRLNKETPHVLIIDSCSVDRWTEALQEWEAEGAYTISLLSLEAQSKGDELKMLYLGVQGIIAFTDERLNQLPEAVRTVADGKLWVRRETLEQYVRETNGFLTRMSSYAAEPFTQREQQITGLLRQGLSNRQIASVAGISERTAKFHVSNILRKYQIDNRKQLRARQPGISVASFNCPPDQVLTSVQAEPLLQYPSTVLKGDR